MKWLFWGSALVITYTYFGYPAWLFLRCRWWPLPVKSGRFEPFVSVILVVKNEEATLPRKLKNLLQLDYPESQLQVVVVSDGSTEETERILREYSSNPRVYVVLNQLSLGKASGINDALQFAQGEIVVFTDARQWLEPQAVRRLVDNFSDPQVGAVSGELRLGDPSLGESSQGLGLYWRIEKWIRKMESASGSVVGVTGALYAARREVLVPLPPETTLDDVYLPMQVVRQGARVVFEPGAVAWDSPDLGKDREFSRKVRTLSGNYQLLQLCPWLLTRENPIWFEFVSHKVLRLVVPFALLAALVACAFLPGPIYRVALVVQLGFYLLSLLAVMRWPQGFVGRVADGALTFVLLNTAALVAFANFVTGRKRVWVR